MPDIPEKRASSPLSPSSAGPLLWWRMLDKLSPPPPLPPSPRLPSPGTEDSGIGFETSSILLLLLLRPAPPPFISSNSSSLTLPTAAAPARFPPPAPSATTADECDTLLLRPSSSSSCFSVSSSFPDDGLPPFPLPRSRSAPPPKAVSAVPGDSLSAAVAADGLGGCGSRCRGSAEFVDAPPALSPSSPPPTTSSSFSLSRKEEKLSAA